LPGDARVRTLQWRARSHAAHAGYGVLMLAIALVVWRIDRLCQRLNWTGMHKYKS
jgi:hypothetical protein